MATVAYQEQLTTITCGDCGIVFAVPESWMAEKVRKHGSFHCPNGHGRRFVAKTEEDVLREQLARQKHRNEQLEAERERQRQDALRWKSAAERKDEEMKAVRARVGSGVCPCCGRTFKGLALHMRKKHPNYRHKDAVVVKLTGPPAP